MEATLRSKKSNVLSQYFM